MSENYWRLMMAYQIVETKQAELRLAQADAALVEKEVVNGPYEFDHQKREIVFQPTVHETVKEHA